MWGPAPFTSVLRQPYADSPAETRAVQYFHNVFGEQEVVRSAPAGEGAYIQVTTLRHHRGRVIRTTDNQARAKGFADHVVSGLVLLDGRPIGELQRMRVASECS